MKISSKYHVTAHDRKTIAAGLSAGLEAWKTPRKTFRISSRSAGVVNVRMTQQERDDYGRTVERSTDFVVAI